MSFPTARNVRELQANHNDKHKSKIIKTILKQLKKDIKNAIRCGKTMVRIEVPDAPIYKECLLEINHYLFTMGYTVEPTRPNLTYINWEKKEEQ